MEEKERKKRVNMPMATLAVLEILQKESDEKHRLSIQDIRRRMEKEPYRLYATRDTIGNILRDMKEFYGSRGRIRCKESGRLCGREKAEGSYPHAYYYERPFSDEEIQFLIDDVLFSLMRSGEQVKALTGKLREMATSGFAGKLNYLDQIPDKQYTLNADVQRNINVIHEAIYRQGRTSGKEIRITFSFHGYGSDKKLHPVKNYEVLPCRICEVNHRYYLICYKEGQEYLWHFRIDLMKDVEEKAVAEPGKDETRTALLNSLNQKTVSEYLSSHLFMYYETERNHVRNITLRIRKMPGRPDASLTFLFDAFGTNWEAVKGTETEESLCVRVKCLPEAIRLFVRRYLDRVEVVGPAEVKQMVEDGIRDDFERFFMRNTESAKQGL